MWLLVLSIFCFKTQVEDIVRDMAGQLNADSRVVSYHVTAENFESIHNHSAYAEISRDKRRV